jgi:hypothetical protein
MPDLQAGLNVHGPGPATESIALHFGKSIVGVRTRETGEKAIRKGKQQITLALLVAFEAGLIRRLLERSG